MSKYNFSSKRNYRNKEEPEEEEEITTEIQVENNDMYIYSEITRELALNFSIELKKLEKKLLCMSFQYDIPMPEIKIHINSEGGDLFAGLSMSDAIRLCKVPVTTIIEGEAASAATIISVVADKRMITKNSYMLIHQMSTGFWGKYNEFLDEMKNQKTLMDIMKKIYNEYTNITIKELNVCLKKDIYWSPEYCLDNGLVDEIL